MTYIAVDIGRLRTIPDKNSWTTFVNQVEEKYVETGISLRACWRDYRNWIVFGIVLLIIGISVLLALLFQPTPPSYPCISYQMDTLASSVSVTCLQWIWNMNCLSTPYTFPSMYNGWWRQSPQGTVMVPCHGTSACGVGSYRNIAVYLQYCQLGFNQ